MAAWNGTPVVGFGQGPSELRMRVDHLGRCGPPLVAAPHQHEFHAVLFFAAPGRSHRLGSESGPAGAGDLVAIPPGTVHDIARRKPGDGFAVLFMPEVASVPWRGPRRASVPHGERTGVALLISALARELRDQRPGFGVAARAQLSLLLVAVDRFAEEEGADSAARSIVDDVVEVIDGRFRDVLSLEAIAAEVNRSERHLTRTVRDLTGESVMQLVDARRMEEARRMLLETEEKVEVIASAVGFHDSGYFRRRFRRAHGVAPTTWRQMNR